MVWAQEVTLFTACLEQKGVTDMGRTEEDFNEVLEKDIREWQEVARYFESIGGDIRFINEKGSEVVVVPARAKAGQIRERIRDHRALIEKLRKSN